ncbi:MAG: HlyU family transcriptional regulator [Pseudomonadota bacterium]
MSFLSKLFGGSKDSPEASVGKSEDYEGFSITPAPQRDGSSWRIAAKITKEIDGDTKSHQMIRADTLGGQEEAAAASLAKAKMLIDEQGDRLFG